MGGRMRYVTADNRDFLLALARGLEKAWLLSTEEMRLFERVIDSDLQLRMLQEQDAEQLFTVADINRTHLREWLPWLDNFRTFENSLDYIHSTQQQHSINEGFACAILYRRRFVGVVGYHPIRWANRSVELGYWLSKDAGGKGIMTRSCSIMIDYAFHELGLNRVAIPIATGNLKSRAVAQRLGFKQEGVVRDAEWLYDHFVDHALYAMLRREWPNNGRPQTCGA